MVLLLVTLAIMGKHMAILIMRLLRLGIFIVCSVATSGQYHITNTALICFGKFGV